MGDDCTWFTESVSLGVESAKSVHVVVDLQRSCMKKLREGKREKDRSTVIIGRA